MTNYKTIIDDLRERGYRITPQREMIVQAITRSNSHMAVEEVLCEVQKHTRAINVATVYRTLEMLWEEGYVCRNDLSEGKIVYSVKSHGPHIHLVCRQCNRVIDADPGILVPLNEILLSQHKFKADLQHISIFGICRECQSKTD